MMKYLVFTAFISICNCTIQAQTKNFIDLPYIEVNGSSDTLITPNEIYIRILISEKDTRDKISIEELEQKMVAALKSIGINTDLNLSTNNMGSNFRSYLLKSKDVIKNKQYILKVSDAIITTRTFIELEKLDISNANIERVDHSEHEQIRNLMRTRAMENAKSRASALAKPLNQAVGAAIHIADHENYISGLQGRVGGITIRRELSTNPPERELADVPFEKIKVTANIQVHFILK